MPVTGVCVGEEGLVLGQRQLPFAIPLYFYSKPLPTLLKDPHKLFGSLSQTSVKLFLWCVFGALLGANRFSHVCPGKVTRQSAGKKWGWILLYSYLNDKLSYMEYFWLMIKGMQAEFLSGLQAQK